jgi:beta-lactam-binding protein with PASTA domain
MKATEIVEKLKSVLLSSENTEEVKQELSQEEVNELEVVEEVVLAEEEVSAEDDASPEDVAEEMPEEGEKYATKEELQAVVSEMKAMYEQIMEKMGSEEMEVEVPAEELSKEEQVDLSAEEPAAEPIAHSPEVEESAKMSFFKQNKPRNTMSVVYEKMFNK